MIPINFEEKGKKRENSPMGLTEIAGWVVLQQSILPLFVKSAPSAEQCSMGNIFFCFLLLQLEPESVPFSLLPNLNKRRGRRVHIFFFSSFISIPHTHTSLSLLIPLHTLSPHTLSYSHSHTLPTLFTTLHSFHTFPTTHNNYKMSSSLTSSTSDAPKIRRVALMGSRAVGKLTPPLNHHHTNKTPTHLDKREGEEKKNNKSDSSLFFCTNRLSHHYHDHD